MNILKQHNLEDIVLIDIETVRVEKELLPDTPLFESWAYKMRYSTEFTTDKKPLEELFNDKAALYAEFGKIVCITIGAYRNGKIQLKSYANDDETILLKEFSEGITAIKSANRDAIFAGHAGKGFDIPYIMRRLIIKRLPLPVMIDVAGLKPWEFKMIDTKELWQATGFYSSSLINIAVAIGLPSPKSDMAGHETSDVYYNEEGGLDRIVKYCEQDVKCLGNIILVMRGDKECEVEVRELKEEKVGVMNELHNTGVTSEGGKKHIKETLKTLTDEQKVIADQLLTVVTTKKK